MYSASGGAWSYGQRITFSFVPDGTLVSGTPSTLYQTMTQRFSDKYVWQIEFMKAAAVWQQVANINLALVSDNGASLGSSGLQQGDPNFGDVRISAVPLQGGMLGGAYLPPPSNGGTLAGDIVLNSTVAWQLDAGFDLETVAIHEFGHALGMSHSQITTAVMYAYYQGVNQTLTTDDIGGIQSIYGARAYDAFNSGANYNGSPTSPTPLNWFLDANNQITIPYRLNITKQTQAEFFSVNAPASGTGSMTVIVQAYGLSMLSPQFIVYDSSRNIVAQAGTSFYGSTAWQTNIPVTAGKTYTIQVQPNGGGSATGAFGLQLNFGSYSPAQIPLFPAYVPAQTDTGGGMAAMEAMSSPQELLHVGHLVGPGDALMLPGFGTGGSPHNDVAAPAPRSLAFERLMTGPTSDASPPASSSSAVFFIGASRGVKKAAYPHIRGIERAASIWAAQSDSPKTFSGRMRSRDGSRI